MLYLFHNSSKLLTSGEQLLKFCLMENFVFFWKFFSQHYFMKCTSQLLSCWLYVLVMFQEPKVYVSTILDVHKKYNALVLIAFNNDSGFVASLDKACGRFINNNAVTRIASSSNKSPELLAKFCDVLLKKSSKNPEEAELEDTLNQVVSVCTIVCL